MLKRFSFFVCFFSCFYALQAAPVADFTLSVKQGCVPLTVSFTNKSTGSPTKYEWDFGNGNKSTLLNPSAIYYKSGNFAVTLTVWDASGAKASKTFNPIRVFRNPTAEFTADTVGCVGDLLNFKDLSTKADTAIVKWTWDYGDGALTNSQNSQHAYTYDNFFTIGLTIVDGYGCKSLETKIKYIRIKPKPKLNFVLSTLYSCSVPVKVTALNSSTGTTSYNWSSTNGNSATTKDFFFDITSMGNVSVTLKATAANGCDAELTKGPIVVQKMKPDFSFPAGNFCQNTDLTFNNTSNPAPSTNQYEWDFGDGSALDKSKNPTHKFTTDGTFTIKLTITNGACVESITKTIVIKKQPQVNVTVDDTVGCRLPSTITARISGASLANSLWNWGDKTPIVTLAGGQSSITHTYTIKKAFPLTYRATDVNGCYIEDTFPYLLHIADQKVDIIPDSVTGCIPKTVKFDITEKLFQQVKSYNWTFNDTNAKYTIKRPTRTFYKRGKYNVILTVTTVQGCVLSDTAQIKLGEKWKPSFYIKRPKDVCNGDTFHWVNTTKPDSIRKKVNFRLQAYIIPEADYRDTTARVFRDSFISTIHGGRYLFKLIANDNGCESTSTDIDTLYVHGPYPKLFPKYIDCKYDKFLITLETKWSNRSLFTIDDSIYNYTKPFIYKMNPKKNNVIKFKSWNDTFRCVDSVMKIPLWPDLKDPELVSSLSSVCAPSIVTLGYNSKVIIDGHWIFPNGDTTHKVKTKYTFNEGGRFIIKLAGYRDSTMCPDTSIFVYDIQGAVIKDRVITSGKCLPMQLTLLDSNYNKDNNVHTWQIGNDFIDVKALSTTYQVNTVPAGNDTAIVVRHLVVAPNGCKSQKTFYIPFSGPKIGYKFKRYAVCDTPMFYFDGLIKDSSKTKFPVQFKWTFSDGTVKNGMKVSGKFKVVGMNYYTVSSTDVNGCTTSYYDSFEVSPNMLQPLFYADPTGRFCPPLQCKFFDQSKTFNAQIVKWEWDFGDGTTSQLQFPEKLYLLPGNYDITLKVTSLNGCTAILKKPGYVIVSGPRGTYDFDRGDACLPHKVEFRGVAIDSATMEWDLGDGVVTEGNNFKHTYTRRGRYIPALILSDTLGCKYTLPPIDTIEVFDYPVATLKAKGLCFHEPIHVASNAISNHEDPSVKSTWYFNNSVTSPGLDSLFNSKSRGYQSIRLVVENKGTCKDTVDVKIKLYAPTAQFNPSKPLVCLGNPLKFDNLSYSDTTIQGYAWDFGDTKTSTVDQPSHRYTKPGQYDVQLIAKDVLNCVDTMMKQAAGIVGDTIPPAMVPIRRASVLNNRSIELVFAKYPTFDFTKYLLYKEANGKYFKISEITSQNDTSFIDNQVNTLSRSYCYKISSENLCLIQSPISASQEHCTIETKAYGKLDANLVKWSPYIGFDSVEYYEIWRQDYNKPDVYKYLATVKGHVFNYIDTLITCNTRQNYRIMAHQYMGFKEYSHSDTATAKPYYFNTTLPNYAWRATVEEDDYTRVEWLDNAWSKNGMKAYLLSKQFSDGRTLFENKYFNLKDTIFDDKNTNVQEHSYVYQLRGLDLCGDTTPISNVAQSILLKCYFDEATQKPALIWNHYNKWSQAISFYQIEQKMPDGSFVIVGKVNATDTQFIHMDAAQNCTPFFRYRVRAISNVNAILNRSTFSLSNEANAFPHSTLFIPNAFSPDKNDLNEIFGPQGQYITKYKFQIYNRWGEKIFETTNCMEGWNGFYKDERCEQDVYLYSLEAIGADKKSYNLKATFHLFR